MKSPYDEAATGGGHEGQHHEPGGGRTRDFDRQLGDAVLQSRATDNTGYVQPTRETLLAKRGPWANYHANMITSWSIAGSGEVTHVYA